MALLRAFPQPDSLEDVFLERYQVLLRAVRHHRRAARGERRCPGGVELFTLRDGDSGSDDVFAGFGILRDDYTPKPAFAALRDLIRSTP
jgi:hypothetical protein